MYGSRESLATICTTATVLPAYTDSASSSHSSDGHTLAYSSLQSPSYVTLDPYSTTVPSDTASMRTFASEATRRPPRYSRVPRGSEFELFDASGRRSWSLKTSGKKKPWATLHIQDTSVVPGDDHQNANESTTLKVMGGDLVSGYVDLNLESPQTVSSIKINVKGKVVTGYLEDSAYTFMEYTTTVWDRSFGDPRNQEPGKHFDGRMSTGSYQFPFTFEFPAHVDIATLTAVHEDGSPFRDVSGTDAVTPFDPSSPTQSPQQTTRKARASSILRPSSWFAPPTPREVKGPSPPTSPLLPGEASGSTSNKPLPRNVYPIPPTFFQRDLTANTKYELTLCISHGRLRGDTKIRVPLSYTPRGEPDRYSSRRRRAYEEAGPIPGPQSDPQGWKTLGPVLVRGTILDKKEVELTCSLWLAQPLSYARGTFIPCFMTISCLDTNTLDLLSQPKLQNVRLYRRVAFQSSLDPSKPPSNNMEVVLGVSGQDLTGQIYCATEVCATKGARVSKPQAMTRTYFEDTPSDMVAHVSPEFMFDTSQSDVETVVAHATWWTPPKHELVSSTTRVLEGEIHLPQTLPPSCPFPAFAMTYTVQLLSFASPLFYPDGADPEVGSRVYLRQPVGITSNSRSDEPIPIPFTQPGTGRKGSIGSSHAHRS